MHKIFCICLIAFLGLCTSASAVLQGDEDYDDTSSLSDQPDENQDAALVQKARALLRAQRFQQAQTILLQIQTPDSEILALWGYSHRKLGNMALGLSFYDRALQMNPNNHLARSYLGMALVELGDLDGALRQLQEMVTRGGGDGHAAQALRAAIDGEDDPYKY